MKGKALILLFVFLLNTVAGFSCAIHMEHQDGHGNAGHHEHQHVTGSGSYDHSASKKILSQNDPCCQGAVNNFISQAKQVPVSHSPLLVTSFILLSHPVDFFLGRVTEVSLTKLRVIPRRQRPPDKDIRISLQSFLI